MCQKQFKSVVIEASFSEKTGPSVSATVCPRRTLFHDCRGFTFCVKELSCNDFRHRAIYVGNASLYLLLTTRRPSHRNLSHSSGLFRKPVLGNGFRNRSSEVSTQQCISCRRPSTNHQVPQQHSTRQTFGSSGENLRRHRCRQLCCSRRCYTPPAGISVALLVFELSCRKSRPGVFRSCPVELGQ